MADRLRVGLVVPHIFMHRDVLPHVIFSPGRLALELAAGLQQLGVDVTLLTPGPVDTPVRNLTADLSLFEAELAGRGDSYLDLLKKHPFTFITLARQVQSELTARAYAMANEGGLDVVHVYTNEEDIALPFAALCRRPVVFTHHDPYNFLVKYKNIFPKYKQLNWLSMSLAQRRGMPPDTNWLANIYHGLDANTYTPASNPTGGYLAYVGRIIEAKGVHLAIGAIKEHNRTHPHNRMRLKIAGKHYAGKKDDYWQQRIEPQIDDEVIEYVGFLRHDHDKNELMAHAAGVIVPSQFQEPFGMVLIEALASGTPVIGLDSGAIPEIITRGKTGFVANASDDESQTVMNLAEAIAQLPSVDRHACRQDFEARFTLQRMCRDHLEVYRQLVITG